MCYVSCNISASDVGESKEGDEKDDSGESDDSDKEEDGTFISNTEYFHFQNNILSFLILK